MSCQLYVSSSTGLLDSPLPDCPVLGMSFMNESFFRNHNVLSRENFKCYCEWKSPGKHIKIQITGLSSLLIQYIRRGTGSQKCQVMFLLSPRFTAFEISGSLGPRLEQMTPHPPCHLLFCQTLCYPLPPVGGEGEMAKMPDVVVVYLGAHWFYSYHVGGDFRLFFRLTNFTLTQRPRNSCSHST